MNTHQTVTAKAFGDSTKTRTDLVIGDGRGFLVEQVIAHVVVDGNKDLQQRLEAWVQPLGFVGHRESERRQQEENAMLSGEVRTKEARKEFDTHTRDAQRKTKQEPTRP